VEPECHPGDDADFGADRFDQAVAELVLDCGFYSGAVSSDLLAELDELGDAASGCPGEPLVECLPGGFGLAFELEDGADAFFEEVGAVEVGVGLLDPGEFRVLPGGELARVLPQRVAGPLEVPGVPGGGVAGAYPGAGDLPAGAAAGQVPDLAALTPASSPGLPWASTAPS